MRTLRLLASATALAPVAAMAATPVQGPAQTVPGSPTDLLVGPARDAKPLPKPDPVIQEDLVKVPETVAQTGTVTGVVFDGVEPPADVANAGRPFLGKPLTIETIQGLANTLSAAYGKTSIALFTVTVPAQTFAGGVVHVAIAEGFIERTLIAGDTKGGAVKQVQGYANAMTGKRPLSKRTLQRYLSLIRDIPGLTTDVKLLRGEAPGAVRMILVLKQERTDFALSYNNLTQRQLADGEVGAVAKLYSGLRSGDLTQLTLSTSNDFKAYGYVGLAHSTPIADGAQFSAAYGHITTKSRRFDLSGDADVASLGVSYPLIRAYQRNATLSAVLDGVNSDNAVLGSLLTRERTRALRLTAGFGEAKDRHALSASLIGAQGLDILGADTAITGNDTGFWKVAAAASASRAIGDDLALRLEGAAQLSDSALPAVERFLVGGDHFGRAFPVATLAGDQGTAASLEFAWLPLQSGSKAFGRSELYVFGDRAAVEYNDRGAVPSQSFNLASAGAGVKVQFLEKATLRAEVGRRIDQPFPSDDDWQFNLAWRLSLGR